MLQAPRPGTYRVRAETRGWAPAYGPAELAHAGEDKQGAYLIRFEEQLLMTRDMEPELEHAQPTSVTVAPVTAASTVRRPNAKAAAAPPAPLIQGVSLGGTGMTPSLGIVSRISATTLWVQFVVDSTGRVDEKSLTVPATTSPDAKASIATVLPRVRYSPARESGKPVCGLQRMQVIFTAR